MRTTVDAWSPHAGATTVTGNFANGLAGRHRLRLEYAAHPDAAPSLAVHLDPPGSAPSAAVAVDKLAPATPWPRWPPPRTPRPA